MERDSSKLKPRILEHVRILEASVNKAIQAWEIEQFNNGFTEDSLRRLALELTPLKASVLKR